MDRIEWLTSDNPREMVDYVFGTPRSQHESSLYISDRKLRLFTCGCVRQSWSLLDDASRRVVEEAERFADGQANKQTVFWLAASCTTIARALMPSWHAGEESNMVIETAEMHNREILPVYANVLRSIVGDPFDVVDTRVRVDCPDCEPGQPEAYCDDCSGSGWVHELAPWLTWNDWAVRRLAEAIYVENDFSPARMGILADTLEEAGCTDERILRHLRGNEPCPCLYGHVPPPGRPQCADGWSSLGGPRVRGDWVIDLLTGRS